MLSAQNVPSAIGRPANTLGGYNQNNPLDPSQQVGDTTNVEIISLAPKLYQWKLMPKLGNIVRVDADTLMHQFQNSNLTEGVYGHYNHLGNMGAPRLSHVFFDRPLHGSSLFLEPLSQFVTGPYDFRFTNSNIPFTSITYYKTFNSRYGEDHFRPYFSVNVNKNLAFGFNFNYLYGRGYYQNQSTAYMNGGLFGSYTGDRYQAHLIYNMYNLKTKENGGITDDRYITNPEEMAGNRNAFAPQDIPVHLSNTYNYNKNFYVFLTHRYNLGFYREAARDTTANDTIIHEEFVPVTSFIHTAQVERSRHRFIFGDRTNGYFANDYLPEIPTSLNDTTTYFGVKNTFGIALLEGFNKYAKAGLTVFASHKMSRYTLMSTGDIADTYTEQEVYVGGELQKREGHTLHYKATGELGVAGEALGQFKIHADADLNVRLGKDTVSLLARASITNTLPAFYMRHYHSRYFWWDNEDLGKEFRTRLEGELNVSHTRTNVQFGVENLKNYTYFDAHATAVQTGENIQVLTARLKQDFKLGILHLDNEVIWQKSSNGTILPLPELSLYHNLYIQALLANVLHVQLGADVRYFTAYDAPAYNVGIQQFHLQSPDEIVKVGNYPIVNLYANLQLKHARFFVMMYHVNQGMSKPNYFLAPHYPINQRLLRVGLSVNFYD
jgi:hypothetical protein